MTWRRENSVNSPTIKKEPVDNDYYFSDLNDCGMKFGRSTSTVNLKLVNEFVELETLTKDSIGNASDPLKYGYPWDFVVRKSGLGDESLNNDKVASAPVKRESRNQDYCPFVATGDSSRRNARKRAVKIEKTDGNDSETEENCENIVRRTESIEPGDGEIAKRSASRCGNKIPVKCRICDKEFPYQSNLQIHMVTHTGVKPYKCAICAKSFTQKANLNTHMSIHTGKKLHECQVCGRSFTQKGNLTVHMTIHTGEKPYRCNICRKSFSQKSYVKAHEVVHSGVRAYECDTCKKSFAHKCYLKTHMLLHTGERPYGCKYCERTFVQKATLRDHEATHTGVKPHVCQICGKPFLRKCNLKQHVLTHDKNRAKSNRRLARNRNVNG